MQWVAQRNKGGAQRAEDIRGVTHCGALGPRKLGTWTWIRESNLHQTGMARTMSPILGLNRLVAVLTVVGSQNACVDR
jgi:hypothetical protein